MVSKHTNRGIVKGNKMEILVVTIIVVRVKRGEYPIIPYPTIPEIKTFLMTSDFCKEMDMAREFFCKKAREIASFDIYNVELPTKKELEKETVYCAGNNAVFFEQTYGE